MAQGITKGEVKRRTGYFLLGVSAVYLTPSIQSFLDNILPSISTVIKGVGIFFLALYLFDF